MAVRANDMEDENGQGNLSDADKVIYVLHPNCAVEEVNPQ
jgi:hypothetical protein